jgi:hypothetical protein
MNYLIFYFNNSKLFDFYFFCSFKNINQPWTRKEEIVVTLI